MLIMKDTRLTVVAAYRADTDGGDIRCTEPSWSPRWPYHAVVGEHQR